MINSARKYVFIIIFSVSNFSYAEPDHLVPVSPYDPTGYNNAVFKSLIVNDVANAYMISLPSFSPEEAIIIYVDEKYLEENGKVVYPVKTISEKWYIKKVVANKKIYQSNTKSDGTIAYEIKPTKDVTEHITSIDKKDADKFISAWKVVLQGTRYYEHEKLGLDGITYLFYTGFNLYGSTWSPGTGSPKMLVDLGETLSSLTESDNRYRGQLLKEANSIADNILVEPKQGL